MEGYRGSAAILRVAAVAAVATGLMLGLASWDGLYDALDLPQPLPALLAQAGGAAFLALALILWSGAARPELLGLAAAAGAIGLGGSALATAGWLVFRDPELDLGIGDLGTVILIVWAAVLGILALLQLRAAYGIARSASAGPS